MFCCSSRRASRSSSIWACRSRVSRATSSVGSGHGPNALKSALSWHLTQFSQFSSQQQSSLFWVLLAVLAVFFFWQQEGQQSPGSQQSALHSSSSAQQSQQHFLDFCFSAEVEEELVHEGHAETLEPAQQPLFMHCPQPG